MGSQSAGRKGIPMFFYEPLSGTAIVSVLLYLVFLIGMNELSRLNKWVGGAIFIALPTVLTIFVWPHTAVEGTGAGTWFQWVKTYSCLAGAILGWLIVYFPAFQKKYVVCIPPIIFAINILEACIRDFQLTGVNGIVDGYMVVGGPWNVMNGIAFGQSASARYIKSKRSFDIAYTIEDNVFKHNDVQLQIEDIRPSE